MTLYKVTRPFKAYGQRRERGEVLEVEDLPRAQKLVDQRYLTPVTSGGELEAAALQSLTVRELNKAVGDIEDVEALRQALTAEERKTARRILQQRLSELEDTNG